MGNKTKEVVIYISNLTKTRLFAPDKKSYQPLMHMFPKQSNSTNQNSINQPMMLRTKQEDDIMKAKLEVWERQIENSKKLKDHIKKKFLLGRSWLEEHKDRDWEDREYNSNFGAHTIIDELMQIIETMGG